MKVIKALVFLCLISVGCFGQGKWTKMADFPGVGIEFTTGFVINNAAYVATGASGLAGRKDFWKYDPVGNVWTQVADFGGEARFGAVGFNIADRGYLTTGFNSGLVPTYFNDTWEYNPANNQWTKKADFGGVGRAYSCAFVIGNKAYVGTGDGSSGANQDFWEYNPASDTWTRKSDFAGGNRVYASGFALNGKGYIGFGRSTLAISGDGQQNDLWEYNALLDQWNRKNDVSFNAISSLGYNNSGYIYINGQMYKYSQTTDTWQILKSGTKRDRPFVFSLNKKIYVVGGFGSADNNFYQFDPNPTPTTLAAATISTSRIDLSWNDEVVDEEKYEIYRSNSSGNGFVKIAEVEKNITSYADTGLSADITYYYKIKAINVTDGFASDFSNEASATTSLIVSINLQAFSQSLSAVRLAWASDNTTIDGYKIERSEDEVQGYAEIAEIPVTNAAGYTDQNLDPGKTYFYRIRAFKGTSLSQYSNRIGANTLVTSTVDRLSQQIKILNNPNTTGIFQIKTEGLNTQNWQAELRDGQMKALPKSLVLKSNAGYRIDLRQKPSGTYFLIFDAYNGKVIKRLIKL
ncbi:MAG TPA: hypothetical protein DCS93_12650 [Microscillaceae bacterium]|nr:hypothetical protein [Microscillaceae bacterium]